MKKSKQKTFIVLIVMLFVGFCGFSAILLSSTIDPLELSNDRIEAETRRILRLGNVAQGDILVNQTYECHACHLSGISQIAPDFEMLAEHAFTQRPELSPEGYLYESIVNPGAHIVADYPNSMPNNYQARLSDEELGSMIVYLMETYVQP